MTEADAIAMVVAALLKAEGKAVLVEHQGNPLRLVARICAAIAVHPGDPSGVWLVVGPSARAAEMALEALQSAPGIVGGATDGHARRGAWSDPPAKVLGLPSTHPPIALVVVLAGHRLTPAAGQAITAAARTIGTACLVIGDPSALCLDMDMTGWPTVMTRPPASAIRRVIKSMPPTNVLGGWAAQIKAERRIPWWPTTTLTTSDGSLVAHPSEKDWLASIFQSGLGSDCQLLVWRHRDADRITAKLRSQLPRGDVWHFGERVRLFGSGRVAAAGEMVITAAGPLQSFVYTNRLAGALLELSAPVQELQLQPAVGGDPFTLLVEPPGCRQMERELKRLSKAAKVILRGQGAGAVFNELSRLSAQVQRAHPTFISTIASVAGIGHWDRVWLDARDLDNAPANLQAALVSTAAGCCDQLNLLAVTGDPRPDSLQTAAA